MSIKLSALITSLGSVCISAWVQDKYFPCATFKPDLIPYICDMAESKQGKYMPGSHIPILDIDYLKKIPNNDYIIGPGDTIKIIVSSITLVIKPLIIANTIIAKTGNGIFVNWKNKIVPKSPIAQPSKHHAVFFALCFQVSLQDQSNVVVSIDI